MTEMLKAIYMEFRGKKIPLGTALIYFSEPIEINEISLKKLNINAKEGDVLYEK